MSRLPQQRTPQKKKTKKIYCGRERQRATAPIVALRGSLNITECEAGFYRLGVARVRCGKGVWYSIGKAW